MPLSYEEGTFTLFKSLREESLGDSKEIQSTTTRAAALYIEHEHDASRLAMPFVRCVCLRAVCYAVQRMPQDIN